MKGDGRKKKWTIVFLVLNHSFGDTVGKVSVIRLPALDFFSFYVCSFGETKRLSTYSIFIQCVRKILSENLADTAKVPVRANSRKEVPIQT